MDVHYTQRPKKETDKSQDKVIASRLLTEHVNEMTALQWEGMAGTSSSRCYYVIPQGTLEMCD